MKIEQYGVDELIPYVNNSRTHSDDQVTQIASSIREFGFTNPILIGKEGDIIAGHGRLLAAKKIKLEKVPVIKLGYLTEAQKKAYVIADNKLAENAGWDEDLLKAELKALEEIDFDLELLGFSEKELKELDYLGEGENDIEEEEGKFLEEQDDLSKDVYSTKGDLWLLGNHRLMCGDSRTDLGDLMQGDKADIVITSPPYNASTKILNKDFYQGEFKDDSSSFDYLKLAKEVLENCFKYTDGFIFWNVSYNNNSKFEYIKQIEDRLDYLIEQVCWKKSLSLPHFGSMNRDWEPVYVFSTGKDSLKTKGNTSNFWEIGNVNSQYENHKACFPLELPVKVIDTVYFKEGIVLDVFGGSGTTLLASELKGRTSYLMELEPMYVDTIVRRYIDYKGSSDDVYLIREGQKKSFSEIEDNFWR